MKQIYIDGGLKESNVQNFIEALILKNSDIMEVFLQTLIFMLPYRQVELDRFCIELASSLKILQVSTLN